MQEIFYNGKIFTNNETNEIANAMLVNDGSIVFVGDEKDVLNIKTNETKLTDLERKNIFPCFFDLKSDIFNKIDEKIKNAKKGRNYQISDDIDENYENFANFEDYKQEYLRLEKEILKNGISTILEKNIDKKSFAFWKKMSEEKLLKIDVVGFVNLLNSKQVMDDNCVTYRKYKNHFRLGGYSLKIDGSLNELKAWMKKPYKGTRGYCGSGIVYGEQLYYMLKMALDEKKQVLFETSGDKSIEEVLLVLKELEEKENISSFYRPVFYGVNVVTRKIYEKIKHFDASLIFENLDESLDKTNKKFIGLCRFKFYKNYKSLIKNNIRFCVVSGVFGLNNYNTLMNSINNKKRKSYLKILKKVNSNTKFVKIMSNLFYNNPAYICFDQDTKASLENQKQANFFVGCNDVFKFEELKIDDIYLGGERAE